MFLALWQEGWPHLCHERSSIKEFSDENIFAIQGGYGIMTPDMIPARMGMPWYEEAAGHQRQNGRAVFGSVTVSGKMNLKKEGMLFMESEAFSV